MPSDSTVGSARRQPALERTICTMPLSAILEYVTAARVRRTGPDPRRQPSGDERCYAYVRAAGVPERSQGTPCRFCTLDCWALGVVGAAQIASFVRVLYGRQLTKLRPHCGPSGEPSTEPGQRDVRRLSGMGNQLSGPAAGR